MKSSPVQICSEEWYYKGCFITKIYHPDLPHKYEVRKDDKAQTFVGSTSRFSYAKDLASENEVKEPLNGLIAYLY